MSSEQQQLEAGIAALQAQRALLGDAVVEASLAGLHARLAALAATAPPAQQLRQVSVLFLDIVGSTQLSQRLDPEEIHGVMDGALARCAAAVQAHQGKVLQFAGDNLLAAFGADVSREDDPERAVRCGLALLALGRVLGAEVQAAHGHEGFDVRVGIHTGSVLLGGGVDAEGTIRGMAVNIAARMEQTAPSGALRISHDTQVQVRGLFDVEPQAPLAVKGVQAPVRSYLVRSARPRALRAAARGIEGVATRMVGRGAELQALQDAFGRLYTAPGLAALTLVADAGIGKSRLLHEFDTWAQAQPLPHCRFVGRATLQAQGQPYGLLRELLAGRFQIADDDTLADARAKFEGGIVPLFVRDDGPALAEGHAHLLGHLVGIEWRDSPHVRAILDDPRQIRGRAWHAATQLFCRVGAAVLQLEDLHWADTESLDFLDHLAQSARDAPLLILGTGRPALFERRPDWQGLGSSRRRLDLQALDTLGSHALVDELLKPLATVPPALHALVAGRAEGNPFYMEELVRMLIDQGAIDATSPRWLLDADKLLATQVPATLTGILQARLDTLPAPEKRTLQHASVAGQVFWDQALIALDPQAGQTLPALVRRELTLPRGTADHDGLREYAFHHQILHQVTYGTVLKPTRRALHGKLAQWLSARTGLRANDLLGATAEHHELAGDDASAAEFHARAAEHAKTRFAHQAVHHHVQRALALLAGLPSEADTRTLRWRLLDARERTLDVQGLREAQRDDIGALARLADALDDDRLRAHAAWRRSDVAMRVSDLPAQQSAARQAVALAARAGADELRLLATRILAFAVADLGDIPAAQALVQSALAEARALGLRHIEPYCFNTLAYFAEIRQDPVASLEMSEQGLAILRSGCDRRLEAVALANVGANWLYLGDLDRARRDLDEGVRLMRANGDDALAGNSLCSLARLALAQGDGSRALALAQAALDLALASQAPDRQALAQQWLGQAEFALCNHPAAARAFARHRALGLEIDGLPRHDATAGLAQVALAQGDLATALQEVARIAAAVAPPAQDELSREVEIICHRVLSRAGHPDAAGWLRRAHTKLMAQAAGISDSALRQSFLSRIPEHREIMAAEALRAVA